MSKLSDLPNEILQIIIEYVPHTSKESPFLFLSATNRRINTLCQQSFQWSLVYATLIKKYQITYSHRNLHERICASIPENDKTYYYKCVQQLRRFEKLFQQVTVYEEKNKQFFHVMKYVSGLSLYLGATTVFMSIAIYFFIQLQLMLWIALSVSLCVLLVLFVHGHSLIVREAIHKWKQGITLLNNISAVILYGVAFLILLSIILLTLKLNLKASYAWWWSWWIILCPEFFGFIALHFGILIFFQKQDYISENVVAYTVCIMLITLLLFGSFLIMLTVKLVYFVISWITVFTPVWVFQLIVFFVSIPATCLSYYWTRNDLNHTRNRMIIVFGETALLLILFLATIFEVMICTEFPLLIGVGFVSAGLIPTAVCSAFIGIRIVFQNCTTREQNMIV